MTNPARNLMGRRFFAAAAILLIAGPPAVMAASQSAVRKDAPVGTFSYVDLSAPLGLPALDSMTPLAGQFVKSFVGIVTYKDFKACAAAGFNVGDTNCKKLEMPLPIVPERLPLALQKDMVYQRDLLVARTAYRATVELNLSANLLYCQTGVLPAFAELAGSLTTIPDKSFCDNLPAPSIPIPGFTAYTQVAIPDFCPRNPFNYNNILNGVISAGVNVLGYSYLHYYYGVDGNGDPGYWPTIMKEALTTLPSAMWWGSGLDPLYSNTSASSGPLIQPVYRSTPNVRQYVALAHRASSDSGLSNQSRLYAYPYYLQAFAQIPILSQALKQLGIMSLVKTVLIPLGAARQNQPGFAQLEGYKSTLTAKNALSEGGYTPAAKNDPLGLATPLEYQLVGATPFYQAYTKWETHTAAAAWYENYCISPSFTFPFLTPRPLAPVPLVMPILGPFGEGRWLTVPEGYPIPYLKSGPTWILPLSGAPSMRSSITFLQLASLAPSLGNSTFARGLPKEAKEGLSVKLGSFVSSLSDSAAGYADKLANVKPVFAGKSIDAFANVAAKLRKPPSNLSRCALYQTKVASGTIVRQVLCNTPPPGWTPVG